MDEGRKRALLIAASILAARKLSGFDGGKRVPATVAAISDAVRWAEELLKAIDGRWPVNPRPWASIEFRYVARPGIDFRQIDARKPQSR